MRIPVSLSTKILSLALLNLVLLGATLIGLAGVQLQNMSTILLAPTRDRILADARLLALDLSGTPRESRDRLLEQRSRTRGITFYLFDSKGERVAGPQSFVPPVVHGRIAQNAFNETFFVTTRNPTRYWVGVRTPIGSPGARDVLPGVLVLMSTSLFGSTYFLDLTLVGLILLLVVLVSGACWIPLIRGLKRSLSQMTYAAQRIADGNFDTQVAADRGDELGHLGSAINQMGTRHSGYVMGQKRFLGDIAHELCSPIARIQAVLGILELPGGETRFENLQDLREEVEHMSALVAELLLFSKAGIQPAKVSRTTVRVEDAVQRAVARESTTAALVNIRVDTELKVLADPEYLFRALSNLIRNSIRYAGSSGPILVSAEPEQGNVLITVSDLGPGLPQDALEQIFEPFHRLEPERSRDTGGAGLGLAIVKSCIEACRGTVRCFNVQPHGLAVEIRLARATQRGDLTNA